MIVEDVASGVLGWLVPTGGLEHVAILLVHKAMHAAVADQLDVSLALGVRDHWLIQTRIALHVLIGDHLAAFNEYFEVLFEDVFDRQLESGRSFVVNCNLISHTTSIAGQESLSRKISN